MQFFFKFVVKHQALEVKLIVSEKTIRWLGVRLMFVKLVFQKKSFEIWNLDLNLIN